MAKVRASIGSRSQVEYLRRLSVVFAVELRLKIVTELFLEEMSPKQFYDEFGGGSLSRVDRNFKKLADHGWLRHLRSETGGRRRGATEHFYRATELAVFHNEIWPLVPYSMRVAISWRTFGQLAERVREALRAETLDARPDSHLSWTTVALDRLGWERLMSAADALFETIFEQQAEARLRISQTGERPMVATIALAAFESPPPSRGVERPPTGPSLAPSQRDSAVPFSVRVSKAFADELCLKIVAEANLRELSAPQFHAEFGGDSEAGIRRRFKKMEETDWLTRVSRKTGGRRRSAVEHFYRATGPAIFDEESWDSVPAAVKPTCSWTTFKQLAEKFREAIATGTLEARLDNHLSWSLLYLDQRGWERVASAVDSLFATVFEERDAADARIAESGEQPILTTVGLAAFESPRATVREP